MIIFRWQAHDSRVEISVSPQRNSNFSHQGLKKKHLIFEIFIWCDLKMSVSPQRNAHFWHPDVEKILDNFPFFLGVCAMRSNLRTAFLSLDAARCRSKSSNSARFHTLQYVSTYRSTPIWTSLDSSDLSGHEKFRFLERAFNLWSATVTEGNTF